jgi:hypothetical protein
LPNNWQIGFFEDPGPGGNRGCGFVVFNNLWRNIRWSLDEISLLPLKKEDGGYYALGSGDPVEEDKRYNADNPTKVKMSYIGRNGEVLYSNWDSNGF